MHMVGHEQCKMGVPDPFCVPVFDSFENVVRDDWVRETVPSALPAAYSNKVVRFAGIDPERNVVR